MSQQRTPGRLPESAYAPFGTSLNANMEHLPNGYTFELGGLHYTIQDGELWEVSEEEWAPRTPSPPPPYERRDSPITAEEPPEYIEIPDEIQQSVLIDRSGPAGDVYMPQFEAEDLSDLLEVVNPSPPPTRPISPNSTQYNPLFVNQQTGHIPPAREWSYPAPKPVGGSILRVHEPLPGTSHALNANDPEYHTSFLTSLNARPPVEVNRCLYTEADLDAFERNYPRVLANEQKREDWAECRRQSRLMREERRERERAMDEETTIELSSPIGSSNHVVVHEAPQAVPPRPPREQQEWPIGTFGWISAQTQQVPAQEIARNPTPPVPARPIPGTARLVLSDYAHYLPEPSVAFRTPQPQRPVRSASLPVQPVRYADPTPPVAAAPPLQTQYRSFAAYHPTFATAPGLLDSDVYSFSPTEIEYYLPRLPPAPTRRATMHDKPLPPLPGARTSRSASQYAASAGGLPYDAYFGLGSSRADQQSANTLLPSCWAQIMESSGRTRQIGR